MLHHLSLPVSSVTQSTKLYDACLGALGYRRVASTPDFAGYGLEDGKDKFAIKLAKPARNAGSKFHLAFAAPSQQAVDDFHKQALANGASDNGKPGLRPHYGPNYYAAFISDIDGHQIEAVHNV